MKWALWAPLHLVHPFVSLVFAGFVFFVVPVGVG